jgi:two-component system, NtrC family, sensor kinase
MHHSNRPVIFFLLVLMICAVSGYGQQQPVFAWKTDTAQTIPDEYVFQLKDTSSAHLRDSGNTIPFNRNKFRHKIGDIYWFTYQIKNETGKRNEIGLDAWSDIADYFVVRSTGATDTCSTGIMRSWKSKKEFRTSNVCSFNIDSAETITVFYRASFKTRVFDSSFKIGIYPPAIRARKDLQRAESRYLKEEGTIFNFFAGFFAMASLIYFFFFYIVREKLFLYFGIFVVLLALTSSRLIQLYALEHPSLSAYINLLGPLSFLSFALFYRNYFDSPKHAPVWDKILITLAILNVVLFLQYAITGKFLFDIQYLLVTILMIITMSVIPFRIRNKDKEHKYFLLYASLPLLILIPLAAIAVLIIRLSGNKVTQDSWLGMFFSNVNYVQLWALTWMVLFFSRTLIKRFTLQREQILKHETEKQAILLQQEQEKTLLMEKLNADLETKVAQRTAELNRSLSDLKAMQSQLIQSEKMASLGEMTAGIAHEIQNPLNFVNNFAEVNQELTAELKDDILSHIDDPATKENIGSLLDNLKENSEKIRTHGKRAESIVKNMLHHSRNSTGLKEDTSINALVQEYAQLAFHGMRAKDKSFQSELDVQLDPSAGNIALIPQEIGRVVLNLMNNAFYAVKNNPEERKPRVSLVTEKSSTGVVIRISDNGSGISEKNLKKIFQPFFTTKPTGEGTGLGLSLSYDIITKGHGGKMEVQSVEQEGTSFIITLPAGT